MTDRVEWRLVTLPDGREVEYVDAKPVEVIGDKLACDVTVTIDGKLAGPYRVMVAVPDE